MRGFAVTPVAPRTLERTGPQLRFDVLDGWRDVAALMVAVFHFNGLHHGFFVPFVANSYLFVDFFFVLSGFVITHAMLTGSEPSRTLLSSRSAGLAACGRFIWPCSPGSPVLKVPRGCSR